MIKKIFIISFLILNFGCAKDLFGTETGNPLQPDPQNQDDCNGNRRCMPTPYVLMTSSLFVKKVSECLGQNEVAAEFSDSVFNQEGLQLEVPVEETSFRTLNESYNKKIMTVDAVAFGHCTRAISDLTCDSAVFKAAFDIMVPSDVTLIHKLFRADSSCQIVFKKR